MNSAVLQKAVQSSFGDSQTVKINNKKAINANKSEIVVVDFD